MVLSFFEACSRASHPGSLREFTIDGISYNLDMPSLEASRHNIGRLLAELCEDIKEQTGASAKHARYDGDGVSWTENPETARRLLVMGVGAGLLTRCATLTSEGEECYRLT